jgi:hypothetical protein
MTNLLRGYRKKAFWANLFVGAVFQILEMQTVFLRFETRLHRDLEPKACF